MGHLQELLLRDVNIEGCVLTVIISHLLVFLQDEIAWQGSLELDPGQSRLVFDWAGGEEVRFSEVVAALSSNTPQTRDTPEIEITEQTFEHFLFSASTILNRVSCFCMLSIDSNTSLCSISSSFSTNCDFK